MKKSFIILLIVFALILGTVVSANAETVSRPSDYITDNAGLLTADEKTEISLKAAELYKKYGCTLYTVILKKYEGNISDYSYGMYKSWGFEEDDNNDVVLFIYNDNEEYWAIQGLGIEYRMGNSELSDYLDKYFAPDYKAEREGKAVLSFLNALDGFYDDFFSEENSVTQSGNTDYVPVPASRGCIRGCMDNHVRNCYGPSSCGSCLSGCTSCVLFPGLMCSSCGSGSGVLFIILGGIVLLIIVVSLIRGIFGCFRGPVGYNRYYRSPFYRSRPFGFWNGFGGYNRFGGGFRNGGMGPGPGHGGPGGGFSRGPSGGSGGGSRGAGGTRGAGGGR